MYQEMRTKDDAWMQSIHESIDQLSEIIDSMPKDGAALQNDDEYLCDKEVAYMLKVSRRTLSEYRSNGTLPYYVLGGKVLYKRSEIEQALKWANDGIGKLIYRRLMIDQFQILRCNNEKCATFLLVHKKVVPLFQDELYINANHASM